eukprot:5629772-Prymnesium_polylepis.1
MAAFLLGNEDEDEPPPERVTLAMKGLTDLHVQWIASFLDEQGENGQAIRLNKEQNEGVRKLYLNDPALRWHTSRPKMAHLPS